MTVGDAITLIQLLREILKSTRQISYTHFPSDYLEYGHGGYRYEYWKRDHD